MQARTPAVRLLMLDDEARSIWRRIIPLAVCVALGIGIGIWHRAAVARGSNDAVTVVLRTALSPVVAASDAVVGWFGHRISILVRSRELARENSTLKRRVSELTEEVADLREARIRADRLEAQLGFVLSSPPAKLPARVVALAPSPHFASIVIGRGSRGGVKAGAVVVAPDGLVGHVYDVTPTTSTVMLASDPRSAVGAMVQRVPSRAVGICHGLGGRLLRFAYLNREADIRKGDTVITSGLGGAGGIYPKGLVLGTVQSVEDDLAASARAAVVRLSVIPDRLEEVAVLK